MEVFNRILCKENIKIEPKFITKSFKLEILKRLIAKVEGKCTKHGYIKHNSIEIYKISPGVIELISLAGNVVYIVYFYADICNPVLGSIVKATIANINRFGILAESGYNLNGNYISVLEIVIAKNSINIKSDIDFDSLKIGDEIKVEIIAKKLILQNAKIDTIGKIVKDKKVIKADTIKVDSIEAAPNILEAEDEEAYEDIDDEKDDTDDEENDDDDSELENDPEVEESEEEIDIDDDEKHGGSEFFSDGETFLSDEQSETYDDDNLDKASSQDDSDLDDNEDL